MTSARRPSLVRAVAAGGRDFTTVSLRPAGNCATGQPSFAGLAEWFRHRASNPGTPVRSRQSAPAQRVPQLVGVACGRDVAHAYVERIAAVRYGQAAQIPLNPRARTRRALTHAAGVHAPHGAGLIPGGDASSVAAVLFS